MMPLPKGSSIITRSRLAITTRAMPTIFFFFMASRMTEGLLADPVFGGEVVGCVAVAVVDRGLGYELLDVNGVRAFNRDVGELVILNLDVGVLADGIALDLLLGRHFLPGDGVHHLPLQAVAGGAVEGVEADFIGGGGGGVDGDGSAHQAQLEVALPVGAGGHV